MNEVQMEMIMQFCNISRTYRRDQKSRKYETFLSPLPPVCSASVQFSNGHQWKTGGLTGFVLAARVCKVPRYCFHFLLLPPAMWSTPVGSECSRPAAQTQTCLKKTCTELNACMKERRSFTCLGIKAWMKRNWMKNPVNEWINQTTWIQICTKIQSESDSDPLWRILYLNSEAIWAKCKVCSLAHP